MSRTTTKEWRAWYNMHQRCENPRDISYKNYGGRGLGIIKRWKEFDEFLKDMGPCPPGLTLDRKDNDKGYTKRNCRWATKAEQNRNRRKRFKSTSGLTDEQFEQIKNDKRNGVIVAAEYGIHRSSVWRIRSRIGRFA